MKNTTTKPLETEFSSQKSFYGKAKVIETEETIQLQSYETIVASYNKDTSLLRVYGWYSTTTMVHINEFIQQLGYEKLSKKDVIDGLLK